MSRARDLGSLINSTAAGKNLIINGGFDIWQRGTSKLDGANGYHTADRWQLSSAPAITFSRQLTSDTTNLPFIQYCMRLQRTAGSTSTNNANITQSFESVNSVFLAGKTVTLSFYARKGANYSATNSGIEAQLFTGTGTDQNVYTQGYTSSVAAINQIAVLTTTWQRFAYTATLATNTNEIGLIFIGTQNGTAGANDWYEITGVQLELGSAATSFSRAGGDIQGELAKCQRYYQRLTKGIEVSNGVAPLLGTGVYNTTTEILMPFFHIVELRSRPTFSISQLSHFDIEPWDVEPTTVSVGGNAGAGTRISTITVIDPTARTAGYAAALGMDTTNGYIEWSAEL